MPDLARLRSCRAKRISSYDRTGGNRDALHIKAGKTQTIASIKGPGAIKHIWVTIACEDEFYLRRILLRAYWDGEQNPSIDSPIGDFFGVGHCAVASYQCAVLNMSANPGSRHAAMNCYFPMPFNRSAALEVVNECNADIGAFYYYVDHELYGEPWGDVGYFHAKWRREDPCDGFARGEQRRQGSKAHGKGPAIARNLSDEGNYLFLDAEGRGHYVGTVLSVENIQGGWWGEGDDMFFVDGEGWPPSLHGTGSEDYFSHAWGMQDNSYAYNGTSYHGGSPAGQPGERITVYRFHLAEPVPFQRSLRASIEHGHANNRSDDYASVAYWYQTEPHKEFAPMPGPSARLPRPYATDEEPGPPPVQDMRVKQKPAPTKASKRRAGRRS